MMLILLLLLLNEAVHIIHTANSITISASTCGDEYDADFYKSVEVFHYGSDGPLYDNPCSVQFTKASNRQYLCVSGLDIHLDCDTWLEYHKSFVKNYIQPEKKFSCYNASLEEWCPSQYQDTIFIVIRKSEELTSTDVIKLRVYLKDVPKSFFDQAFSTNVIIFTVVGLMVVFIFIFVAIIICVRKTAALARDRRPRISYQTTTGAVNMQSAAYQPSSTNNSPQQGGQQGSRQQQLTQLQGNYNVHPMQTAYPVQQGANPSQSNTTENGRHFQNSQQFNFSDDPPSYESVVGTKY